jgi:hypothetical protein
MLFRAATVFIGIAVIIILLCIVALVLFFMCRCVLYKKIHFLAFHTKKCVEVYVYCVDFDCVGKTTEIYT